MTDLVERLRLIARRQTVTAEEFERTLYKAADEIERLRSCIGACLVDLTIPRETLKPDQRIPLVVNRLRAFHKEYRSV